MTELQPTRRSPGVRAFLKRIFLNRSDPDYLPYIAGTERYWDEAISAQLGWTHSIGEAPDQARGRGAGPTEALRRRLPRP
jgi:hypothetical protein